MNRKRSREGEGEGEAETRERVVSKATAARVSPAIVTVTSDLPDGMRDSILGYFEVESLEPEYLFFSSSGVILDCEKSAHTAGYLCTVLAPACIFKRPTNFDNHEINIDVGVSTGLSYKAKLLASDFHYNLALVQFISNSPLKPVTLSPINVSHSTHPTDDLHSLPRSQLHPHSDSFNILPGTDIISVSRAPHPPFHLDFSPASFSSRCPKGFSCNELYGIKIKRNHTVPLTTRLFDYYKVSEGDTLLKGLGFAYNDCYRMTGELEDFYPGSYGGPVLNSFGSMIGIIFNTVSFLPSNIVARWWTHYKIFGKFRRPFLGMEVAYLHDADLDIVEQSMTRFPNISISTALIVTKVAENSQACYSGIRTKDEIVKLDGELVKSKLQFFETIWEKTGKSVEFNVLRVTDDKELNVSLVIEEASPDKFHWWPQPQWHRDW